MMQNNMNKIVEGHYDLNQSVVSLNITVKFGIIANSNISSFRKGEYYLKYVSWLLFMLFV